MFTLAARFVEEGTAVSNVSRSDASAGLFPAAGGSGCGSPLVDPGPRASLSQGECRGWDGIEGVWRE